MKQGHISEFDGMRGLAALAVVLGHTAASASVMKLVRTPSMAVTFFFVLSGFLITGILLGMRSRVADQVSRPGAELKTFYFRRALRIFPPFYAMLFFFYFTGDPFVTKTFWWHAGYASNLYPSFVGPLSPPIPHFWTLAVEEQFYLLWPFVVMFVPARRLKAVLLFMIGSAVVFRWATWGPLGVRPSTMLPLAHLDALGLGSLLAVIAREKTVHSEKLIQLFHRVGVWVALPVMLIGVALAFPQVGLPQFYQTTGKLAIALVSVALLIRFSTPSATLAARLLRSTPFRYLGRISYGVYIYHYPFIHVFARATMKSSWSKSSGAEFVFVFVCTLLTATASWFLLERPLLSLKRFFSYDEGAGAIPAHGTPAVAALAE